LALFWHKKGRFRAFDWLNCASRRVKLCAAKRAGVATTASHTIVAVGFSALAFAPVGPALPENKFQAGGIVGKISLKFFEVVFHFSAFGFRRASLINAPSCVISAGVDSPRSHLLYASKEMSPSSATASAWVILSRSRSYLRRCANRQDGENFGIKSKHECATVFASSPHVRLAAKGSVRDSHFLPHSIDISAIAAMTWDGMVLRPFVAGLPSVHRVKERSAREPFFCDSVRFHFVDLILLKLPPDD
jgi:hypothetical protein